MGTSWLLPRLIGASRSHELMLTGRRVDAEEALRIGLVADVVDGDALAARALEAASQIAALAPWGVRLTKQGMWTRARDPLRAGRRRVRGPPADHEHVRPRAARGDRGLPREAPGGVRGLMSDLFDVSGKTALVTGGSRGIGLMIARGLVQAGARVIVSSRKEGPVDEAASELSRARRLRGRSPATSRLPRARARSRRGHDRALPTRSTSSSTTPARPGARRSRSSRQPAGTASCTRTSRASST